MYDVRSTQHDPSTESAWTISALTPAFSALDPAPYGHVEDDHLTLIGNGEMKFSLSEIANTLTHSYRRSLAFPLYRSFAFAEKCRIDIADILDSGKRTVVRCLLEMKKILDGHDVYYVYSKIWVDDFCVWTQAHARFVVFMSFVVFSRSIQCHSDDVLRALARSVRTVKMEKVMIGWSLDELEVITHQTLDRDNDSDDESDE